jgi:LAO/AO transport system kinase
VAAPVDQILEGNRRAIARLISQLENNHPAALDILVELYPHTGQAYLVGVTGAPGTGKSTLVNEMVKLYRSQDQSVAVLSIDPTSPFTGGAILGDRIRLKDLAGDSGIFIRSMATRGSLGGLARAAADSIKVFDAAGFEIIIIETVGVGQAEVEIARLAHSVIVVDVPGLGDDVQAIKAGLLEIADIFVVNKADRDGVDRTVAALKMMLDLNRDGPAKPILHHGVLLEVSSPPQAPAAETHWQPPICKTIATTGVGVDTVIEALAQHRTYQQSSGLLAQREQTRLMFEIEQILKERLLAGLMSKLSQTQFNAILTQVTERQLDPYTAVETLLRLGENEGS